MEFKDDWTNITMYVATPQFSKMRHGNRSIDALSTFRCLQIDHNFALHICVIVCKFHNWVIIIKTIYQSTYFPCMINENDVFLNLVQEIVVNWVKDQKVIIPGDKKCDKFKLKPIQNSPENRFRFTRNEHLPKSTKTHRLFQSVLLFLLYNFSY